MVFRDRNDAGRMLAEELLARLEPGMLRDGIALGVPRGGAIVAAEVAHRLDLPLDVVIASKIGAPGNPEFAVGAVDADGVVMPNERAGYSLAELEHFAVPVRAKIASRLELYRAGRSALSFSGKTAIVIDDGIATGLTVFSAVGYLERHGAERIVVAVPVIARDAARAFRERVDALVAVEEPDYFNAVGQFYRRFEQTTDDEVLAALGERRPPKA